MQRADTILSVSDLRVSFPGNGNFVAVNNISFTLGKGRTLAIVGESGSGKSLTALALMGLLPPQAVHEGKLILHPGTKDISLNAVDRQQIKGKEIGMVFQEPMSSLNPVMSIGKQLQEAIMIHQSLSKADAKELAIDWLGRVQLPAPGNIYARYPHQLSGGQKQRVMIAMAMCNHPSLLLADEPTTALDVTVQHEIIGLMGYLQQEHGAAMIFITHDLSLAARIADDVLVMWKGEAIEYGPASQVIDHPAHAYTKALLACRPAPGKKGYRLPVISDFLTDDKEYIPQKDIVRHWSEDTLLSVSDIRVWFPEHKTLFGKTQAHFKAVDGVSFQLKKGEVLGLVGESGCGKSTVCRALMGLVPVNSGSMQFNGEELSGKTAREWRTLRRQIQMIFQDPYASLNPRMTIGDMLAEPLITHEIVSRAGVNKETHRLLDLVQLPSEAAYRYPHQFSGGQRQRIGIARALALRPQLLICDESVSALDVSIQAQVLNLLKDLQQEFDLTYLFISHDLSVVHYFSDRVMVMHEGKIVEEGPADAVFDAPAHEYTRRLIASTR